MPGGSHETWREAGHVPRVFCFQLDFTLPNRAVGGYVVLSDNQARSLRYYTPLEETIRHDPRNIRFDSRRVDGPRLASPHAVAAGKPVPLCEAVQTDGPAETIFALLDGHDYEIDGRICRVAVYGIFDDGAHRWVQLEVDGHLHVMLTFRMRDPLQADCALVSLAATAAA
jgi:hypothetical protein